MSVHAVDWGDVPTWLSAVTTLGALFAAGWVVVIELGRERRAERLLEEQRDAAARSEQANLVAAWSDWDRERPCILIRNGSALPIYNVRVELTHHSQPTRPYEVQVILPPGDHRAVYPADIVGYDALGDVTDSSMTWSIRLNFYDAAGRSWMRDELGRLQLTGRVVPLGADGADAS